MMPHQTIFGQTGKKSKEKAQINVFDKMLMKTIFLLSLSLHIYIYIYQSEERGFQTFKSNKICIWRDLLRVGNFNNQTKFETQH